MSLTPIKRKNLREISDSIFELQSAIKVKMEVDQQIESMKALRDCILTEGFWDLLSSIFFSLSHKRNVLKREIEKSKLEIEIDVKTKVRNTYHLKETNLESSLTEIYEAVDERFLDYITQLTDKFLSMDKSDPHLNDVSVMYESYRTTPPEDKIQRLMFFLSLEELLCRVHNI